MRPDSSLSIDVDVGRASEREAFNWHESRRHNLIGTLSPKQKDAGQWQSFDAC
jgi:hypothetical protein